MGIMNHNAVIATTWDDTKIQEIKEWVSNLETKFRSLFVFAPSICNGHQTIILAPDGSKEGWDESKQGDHLRECFIAKLKEHEYEDGSSPWSWVELSFGEFGQEIVAGNNKNQY